jgi:hypothetical protein
MFGLCWRSRDLDISALRIVDQEGELDTALRVPG